MPIRVFSAEEKEELRQRMLEAGLPLLKEYGMTHMSVDKIADAAGIGKSTFYNFFSSKEEFVSVMLQEQRKKVMMQVQDALHGRDKMTVAEGKALFRKMVINANSLYQYLTPEDEAKLYHNDELKKRKPLNLDREIVVMQHLFSMVEGVKENPDYPTIANFMKLMAMGAEQRYLLHETGYEKMQEEMLQSLFRLIFIEN